MNPLNKIIFLSGFLASGFLLILLSCALYNNWKPIIVIFIFLVAPLPNIIANSVENNRDDFLTFGNDRGNNPTPLEDVCKFITGTFVVSGIALPIMLHHTHLIQFGAMVLSITGGLVVYVDIILFIWFFEEDEDDTDELNF